MLVAKLIPYTVSVSGLFIKEGNDWHLTTRFIEIEIFSKIYFDNDDLQHLFNFVLDLCNVNNAMSHMNSLQ